MPNSCADSLLASAADHAACRALIRQGSKSFFLASLLLPATVREPALALYAFCREADDLVDLAPGGDDPLARLGSRLARAYEGRPLAQAADRAFADVVLRFAVPRALPEALLEGFRWDAAGRRYATLAQLHAYAARVAGSVGAMMACLMDVRSPPLVARACDLGVAMQLTNIARDVGEDARAGRLYLPLEWLGEAGIEPDAWLRRPTFTPALAGVIARLLAAADVLYARAGSGIAALPTECRRGIHAARSLYAEIGHALRRNGLDSVSRRTVVSLPRKAAVLTRALALPDPAEAGEALPPLPQTQFLVDAVAAERRAPLRDVRPPRSVDARVEWLVELFERLERRDRAAGRSFGVPGD